MKNKSIFKKFGLLVALFALAFSSFSMADDAAKDASTLAAEAKVKAYYDTSNPKDWETVGYVGFNADKELFRALIQVQEKDSKEVKIYILPLNLTLKKSQKVIEK
ncbi:hypothetical protein [uncultured Gammaproteobacteria bacterium]|nr:hypothetical protein [uncultured Gammaproteobacteria bacterium]